MNLLPISEDPSTTKGAHKTIHSMKATYSPPKRRLSRQSNMCFNNIDYNYIGDTSKVTHLIQRRIGGVSPNKGQLDHELNLRRYQCGTSFKVAQPWIYPVPKEFKAVIVDKSDFPLLQSNVSSSVLNSPKGIKNMNSQLSDNKMSTLVLDHNKPYND